MQTRHFVVRTKVFGLRRGRCWRCMGQEVRWRGARAACLSAAMRVRCARRNTHTTDTQHQRHVVKYIRAQELWSRGLQAPLWSCRSRPVLRNLWLRAPPRTAPQLCTDTALRPRLRGRALDHRFHRTGLHTSTEGRADHRSTPLLHRYGTPRTGARPQVPQNGPRHLRRGARTPQLHSSAQIRLCDHDSADVR